MPFSSAILLLTTREFATNAVTLLVVLGFLVFIHELGHFVAAKMFGVRVEQFAIGFGKRLVGFRRGDTDYRINLLPLGGYVKMAGENPFDGRTTDAGEFMNHARWQRFFIAIAGPAMNILLAIALLAGVYMVRYEHADYEDSPLVVAQDAIVIDSTGLSIEDVFQRMMKVVKARSREVS